MPTVESISAISRLTLIQAVDNKVAPDDPHQLAPWLRTQVDTDLAKLEAIDQVASTSELARSEKSLGVRNCLDRLESLVREGYRFIGALRSTVISEDDRAQIFAEYGWTGGLLGRMSDDRIVALARIGMSEHADIDPLWRYPADLVEDLKASVTAYQSLVPEALQGANGSAVRQRNEALTAAEQTIAQVRYWYCAASRQTVRNPNLANIGFHPRRRNRSKEEVELSAKRQEEKRQERERKQLQRLEEAMTRDMNRLEKQIDQLRAKQEKVRGSLGVPSLASAPAPAPSAPDAGDVSLMG
jgi:hypothetical protein